MELRWRGAINAWRKMPQGWAPFGLRAQPFGTLSSFFLDGTVLDTDQDGGASFAVAKSQASEWATTSYSAAATAASSEESKELCTGRRALAA